VIDSVLGVFLLLLVGYGAKKLRLLRAEDSNVLNEIVIYITLPALIFTVLYGYKANLSLSIARVPIVGFVMIAVVLAAAYGIGRAMRLDSGTLAGFILAAGFGNTGFLGYPVTQAAFKDPSALVTAVLYDEFGMALPLYIIGLVITAVLAGQKAHYSQVTQAFKYPQLWAIPIALLLRQSHCVPHSLIVAIGYLGSGTIPIVMISLGLMLSARSMRGYGIPLAVVCMLKLAVLPIVTCYGARFAGITGTQYQTTVMEAGMPTAMMVGVLVSKFGENPEFVAGVIFVTTLLSIVTIPATLLLVGAR
jgi:hypothetical protein